MTDFLYELGAVSLKGSMVFVLIVVANLSMGRSMKAKWKRLWWLLIPAAFLLPFHVSVPVLSQGNEALIRPVEAALPFLGESTEEKAGGATPGLALSLPFLIWVAGATAYLLGNAIQTLRVNRRWAGERLSTDPGLITLLEDCKEDSRVSAPIGLIVSDRVSTPALLGWLRPRILIPRQLASNPALRSVLLHELAHFKHMDIGMNWLFTIVRAIHWFNPLAHVAAHRWGRFREEAADEYAMKCLSHHERDYGEDLVQVLRSCQASPQPMGALAIFESPNDLKHRIQMIRQYPAKSPRRFVAAFIAILCSTLAIVTPGRAEQTEGAMKSEAVKAMEGWLAQVDQQKYAQTWQEASVLFQKYVTSAQWEASLQMARTPLGALKERKLSSAVYRTQVPGPAGKPLEGRFVIAQFAASFANLTSAIETVTFEQDADGTWKASGYFIKPG